jgi:hypothetical protein
MAFKGIEDIEREKHKEERDSMKREVTEDINDIIGNVFRKPKKKKDVLYYIFLLMKIFGVLILLMIIINLILGNIWLLKFFIKDLF